MNFLSKTLIEMMIMLIIIVIGLWCLFMYTKDMKDDIKRIEKDIEYLNRTFIKMAFE